MSKNKIYLIRYFLKFFFSIIILVVLEKPLLSQTKYQIQWFIEPTFLQAYPFSEGFAPVLLRNWENQFRWHYIDSSGIVAINASFIEAYRFNNGSAIVRLAPTIGSKYELNCIRKPLKTQNKYQQIFDNLNTYKDRCNLDHIEGLIKRKELTYTYDNLGNRRLFFDYSDLYEQELKPFQNKKSQWGFRNKEAIFIRAIYENVGFFSQSLAPVKLNGKWGYIDKNSTTIIPFIFEDAQPFTSGKKNSFTGKACVKIDDRFGYIYHPFRSKNTPSFHILSTSVGLYADSTIVSIPFSNFYAESFVSVFSECDKFNKELSFSVLTNENATKYNIINQLKDIVAKFKENDKAIIYFSGHGGDNFNIWPFNYSSIKSNHINILTDLLPILKDSEKGDYIFIVESCRNPLDQSKQNNKNIALDYSYEEQLSTLKKKDIKVAILWSTSENTPSFYNLFLENDIIDGGVFSYFLFQALLEKNLIDQDNNKWIDLYELYINILSRLEFAGISQKPVIYPKELEKFPIIIPLKCTND